MIVGRVEVEGALALKPGEYRALLGEAYAAAMIRWHGEVFPERFREDAYQRFGIRPRSLEYVRRKRRVKGHNRPMEWTGETRRQATARFTVTSSSRQASGRMDVPAYVFYVKDGRRVSEELSDLIPREQRQIRDFVAQEVVRRLNESEAKSPGR